MWEEGAAVWRFRFVLWNSHLLLAVAVLLPGCATTTRNVDAPEVVGVSRSSPASTLERALPPSAKPPPDLNPALCDGAPAKTVSAYEYLLVTAELALGDECGAELGSTSAWRALSILVQDRRPAMLWDLTARARASEARAAAIIGLAKLGTISYADARDLLRQVPGTISVCKGSTQEATRPVSATEFLPRPLDGQSNALSMP